MIAPFILVPRTPAIAEFHGIKRGSGIAGTFLPNDEIRMDYEGNIYGHSNKTWVDCIVQAAGRHVERYPTVARSVVPKDGWIAVGSVTEDKVAPPLPAHLQPIRHEIRRMPGMHERKLLIPHFDLTITVLELNAIVSEWLDHPLTSADLILTGYEWLDLGVGSPNTEGGLPA